MTGRVRARWSRCRWWRCSAPAPSACRSRAIARFATDRPAEQVLYVQSPEVVRRLALSYEALAADVYWIRALQHFGGSRQQHRAASGATSCSIRCWTWRRRSTRSSTSPTASARSSSRSRSRAGPGRPDQAIALLKKGLAGVAEEVAVHPGHRLRPLLGEARLHGGRRLVREGQRSRPARAWFLKPLAATTLAQGGAPPARRGCCSRRSPRRARTTGCARTRCAACDSSTRWTRMDQLRRSSASTGARRGGAVHVGAAGARGAAARHAASIPTASIFALGPWTGDVGLDRAVDAGAAASRAAGAVAPPPVPHHEPPAFVIVALALFGLTVGSFLNVCIYRIPHGESIVFPASRCTVLRRPLRWYHNMPVVSWLRVARPLRVLPAPGSRRAIRPLKRSPASSLRCTVCSSSPARCSSCGWCSPPC